MALKINSKSRIVISYSIRSDYVQLWNDIRGDFEKQTISSKYILKKDTSPSSFIPCIEICDKISTNSPILFVGMNPSGADISHYKVHNTPYSEVFIYNGGSQYYSAMERFAKECINEPCYSELDLFGIVQSDQKVVEKHIRSNKAPYDKMFNMFLDNIVHVNPRVIIVANAFARKIIESGLFNSGHRYDIRENPKYGGYKLTIYHGVDRSPHSFQVYFSSMLSGQRALDKGSWENLVWLVRNYLAMSV